MLKVRTVADICFRGEGGSPGKAEGPVRIIHGADDWENLPRNAIIILKECDDKAINMLTSANGIIIEQATVSPHTAAVAKEMHIPVVCNFKHAATTLENDQIITIDGSSGQISYGRASV